MIERLPSTPTPAPSASAPLLRVPPHSLEAEVSLLGALLLDPDAAGSVVPLLQPEDFYARPHRRLFEVVRSLFDRGEPADPIIVMRECERLGILDQIGGREFLASLAGAVESAANVEHYARIVREKSIARGLIHATADIQRAAYDEEGRGDDLLELAEHTIFELSRTKEVATASNIRSLLEDTFRTLDKRDGVASGVPTGFYQFDDLTAGLHKGELIIIAGRPSMGKTTFALNCAYNIAVKSRVGVAIFSLEMSRQQITKNILCAHAKVQAQKLRGGKFLDDAEYARLVDAAGPLYEAPLFIDDTAGLSTTALRAKARRLKQKYDIGLIVIDYLQLMEATGASKNVDSRQQEISYISRTLKAIARELDVPVIALSQLNREADSRDGNRPRLSDLRESGALEQDADVICLLFRKFYYSKAESDRGLAEVIIAKQRNGPTDTVRLAFMDQYMLFDNLSVSDPPA